MGMQIWIHLAQKRGYCLGSCNDPSSSVRDLLARSTKNSLGPIQSEVVRVASLPRTVFDSSLCNAILERGDVYMHCN
jgi:hypothetical protein